MEGPVRNKKTIKKINCRKWMPKIDINLQKKRKKTENTIKKKGIKSIM